jgi:quinol monooxygenase YgiN
MPDLPEVQLLIGAYRSYMVRLWQSYSHGVWRASVRSVQTGEIVHFPTLAALYAYLDETVLIGQDRNPMSQISQKGDVTMNHARFVYAHIHPEKIEEAIALFRDSVLPATEAQPGFKGARLLVDRGIGKAVIVTLWASEAEMKATETSGYLRTQLAKFSDYFTAPPTRESYELVISV